MGFFHCMVSLNTSPPPPSRITTEIEFVIYGYQNSSSTVWLPHLSLCLSVVYQKSMGTRDFKGNSFLRSAQWEAEEDKKQALYWYLLSAKCFLNTVQYTGKDMVHAPWGYHLNRTDEVRHNWLNSYPVLMTSLWEPKSSSVETGAIHQTLTSTLCPLRAWHSQPHQEGELSVCLSASYSASFPRHSLQWPRQQWEVNRRLCEWSRRIRKTLILEIKAQPNTSRIALLAAIFNISLQWLQPPTCSPVSSYTQWRSLNAATDWTLSSWWPDYALWPALQTLILHILTKGPHKPKKNYFSSPHDNIVPLLYTCLEKL